MKIKRESSRLLKPSYPTSTHPSADVFIPLSPIDTVSLDTHVVTLHAYRPPNPANKVIELGLRKALTEYRELAGRLVFGDDGRRCILLNDQGMRFVEATGEYPFGYLDKPSPDCLDLHLPITGIEELALVQLTRFACGSLVVGSSTHQLIADGFSTSHFMVAWGRATRDLPMNPLPLHDRTIFVPRNPPFYQFDHHGVEYVDRQDTNRSDPEDIALPSFWQESSLRPRLTALAKSLRLHLSVLLLVWRKTTGARGLDGKQFTKLRMAVNGYARMSNQPLLIRYFSNVVLWATPESKVEDLLAKARTRRNDYFRSFIDFSSSVEKTKALVPSADAEEMVLSPDMEVVCWQRFPFLDFGFWLRTCLCLLIRLLKD